MKIGLIDVDGHNFPNLALMKISSYHKQLGNDVEFVNYFDKYDLAYCSKVFTFTPDVQYEIQANEIYKGGTGYDLTSRLPESIEHRYPDYSLYGITDTAYGYITRGCPRQCPFCIVANKEGTSSHMVANVGEFWSGQKTIRLLDPNMLACKERDLIFSELENTKAYIDFTQGLDVRLVNDDVIERLKRLKIKQIHFAWDNQDNVTENKLREIKDKWKEISRRKCGVYILTNFNTSFEFDKYRVETVKSLGFNPYVMIYDKQHCSGKYRRLQRYANCPYICWSIERFEDYK